MALEDRPVSRELVLRKLDDTFPGLERADALSILDAVAGKEPERVQLGLLKLCGGNLEKLREWGKTAAMDYRDVLASAEFPGELRLGFAEKQEMGARRLEEVREEDRRQYLAWLEGGPGDP